MHNDHTPDKHGGGPERGSDHGTTGTHTAVDEQTQPSQQHETCYTVDGKPQETASRKLTPVQLLDHAGVDPRTHYLVRLDGPHCRSYRFEPEVEIHVNDGDEFVSAPIEPRAIEYTVDGEPQRTTSRELTPRQILDHAGINPNDHYLVRLRDHHRDSYQNDPDVEIHLREHDKFIAVSTGPTAVS